MQKIQEATLTSQGQISLPKKVRDKLHVNQGDKIAFFEDDDGRIFIQEIAPAPALSTAQWDAFLAKTEKEHTTRVSGKKAALAHLDRLGKKT